jgi:DICT domain-containing protein
MASAATVCFLMAGVTIVSVVISCREKSEKLREKEKEKRKVKGIKDCEERNSL